MGKIVGLSNPLALGPTTPPDDSPKAINQSLILNSREIHRTGPSNNPRVEE
jgi:hypothetical protein